MNPTLILAALLLGLGASASARAAEPPLTVSTPAPPPSAAAPGPLSQEDAVRRALSHSPALQALLARSEAQAAQWRADSRPGLFGLSLARLKQGDEREIDRHLSLGLVDLLLWPWRSQAADRQIDLQQQSRALAVLDHAQAVRSQWVKAVAAQARAAYQADVLSATTLAAELARRLADTGQFSAAQRDARLAQVSEARWAQSVADQQARREREALIRLLGLRGSEATDLRLPDTLPPLPATPRWTAQGVQAGARQGRLDVRLAEARWRAVRGVATADAARSVLDLDLGWERNTSTGTSAQQGPTLDLRLVSIDLGAARREARRQDEVAALAELAQRSVEAESQIRERWADHQAALAMAREASEVLTTLRSRLLDERLKQYNGMLIGPLELLDEARAQRGSVQLAIDALRDHWLSDAALQAAIEGSSAGPATVSAAPSVAPATDNAH